MTPVTSMRGKRVAIFGLGGSGLATARALAAGGATVVPWDDAPEKVEEARREGFAVEDLHHSQWRRFAALVLAPGVPLTHPKPHWTVELAKAAGVEVIGDIELFCRERAKIAPRSPFIAITGTNGKSTTTALIAHILRRAGRDVAMGGNIGTPILALAPPAPERIHVIECSSFQIDLAPSLAPTLGVLLNITPDHLDRHGTMENYAAIKARLVARAEYALINFADEPSRAIFRKLSGFFAPDHLATMNAFGGLNNGCALRSELGFMRGGDWRPIYDLKGIPTLRGKHNADNALAAILATSKFLTSSFRSDTTAKRSASKEAIPKRFLSDEPPSQEPWPNFGERCFMEGALRSFPGLAHRMEEVGRAGRVLFINDSKATNADSAEKALSSFSGGIFWILGGRAKQGGIESLRPLFQRVEKAYLIGEATREFAATLSSDKVPKLRCGTLEIAVERAARDAAASGANEPIVLLSPACASYDQFKNFEARGDRFRELARRLIEEARALRAASSASSKARLRRQAPPAISGPTDEKIGTTRKSANTPRPGAVYRNRSRKES
ncbi:MAG: UDP-N-acetylmuramoyl-L-alanine--D-glutamate ligase [Hyphomicrobiales bacterium]|nr:UDP-N-acetylmuramoyl-L-alanine--D-glutamate ligase [Hyphomicrobiales bacterium]